jgi:UMP-CMP kinase
MADAACCCNALCCRVAMQVFVEQSMPIIDYYEKFGKVRQISADRSPDEIYKDVEALFKDF